MKRLFPPFSFSLFISVLSISPTDDSNVSSASGKVIIMEDALHDGICIYMEVVSSSCEVSILLCANIEGVPSSRGISTLLGTNIEGVPSSRGISTLLGTNIEGVPSSRKEKGDNHEQVMCIEIISSDQTAPTEKENKIPPLNLRKVRKKKVRDTSVENSFQPYHQLTSLIH
jgi:hypothetical protein